MGVGTRLGRVALIASVALMGGLALIVIVFETAGTRVATVVSDLVQVAAAVFGGLMCLRVGPRSDPDGWVRGWRLIGLGVLAWGAGNVVWTYYEVVLQVPAPKLTTADIGFLAMVPFVLFGVGRLIGIYRGATIGILEGLIIAFSLFYLSWATVLGPTYAMQGSDNMPRLLWTVNVAYPLGDVASAAAALVLLGSARSAHRAAVALLAAGLLAMNVADSTYVAIANTYRTGHPIDLAWTAGLLLIGAAGIVATTAPHAPDIGTGKTRTSIVLPYIPLSLAALTSIIRTAGGHPPSLMLSVLLVALFGLVVARQVLALRERDTLLRQVGQQREILNQLAFTDPLTGLANRAMFEERITPADRLRQTSTSIMFVDLDQFKEINDLHGHDIGDAVLVAAAERLRRCCRAEDTVARVGGDEFVVLAQGVSAGAVERIAQRFVRAMRQPVTVDGTEVVISASMGIATGDTHDIDVHELIRRADAAMYMAKLAGPGRYACYGEHANGAATAGPYQVRLRL
jgi:diguanylate cyclase (GGDEF)-like protein